MNEGASLNQIAFFHSSVAQFRSSHVHFQHIRRRAKVRGQLWHSEVKVSTCLCYSSSSVGLNHDGWHVTHTFQ